MSGFTTKQRLLDRGVTDDYRLTVDSRSPQRLPSRITIPQSRRITGGTMPFASRPTVILTLLAAVAAPLAAQDVQYTTVTKVDMGGGMNAVLRMTGASEVRETAYIKGKKLRSDGEKQSTIFDLENSRYIVLNHSERTYTSVPIADMARATTSAMRGVKAEASKDQIRGTARDTAGNKADFVTDIKIEPTKERRNINGNDAERVIITMDTDVKVTPQGETEAQDAGKLVILMDTWNANTGPASDAVRAWEQAASKEVAAAAFGRRGSLGPAAAANPKMGEAMKKAAEEAQKIDGIAVLSTTHLVIVAPGQKFDRALALKETEGGASGGAEKPKGLRGMIGRAIEAKAGQQEQKPQQDQTQGTLAKVRTEIRDVKSTSLPASLFEIPAGYREVKLDTPR